MYTIHQNKELQILEVSNPKHSVFGKIYLNEGASLQELTLEGSEIIQDLHPLPYSNTYASSILFPFANRIKDGKYSFEGNGFQFEINQQEENNALHGLVYNKTFRVINVEALEDAASVTLEFIEPKRSKGFPYSFSIQVTYVFNKNSVQLKVVVKNTDDKKFPFTLGWHPYFMSSNLSKSTIDLDCIQKIIIGDRNITTGIENIKPIKTFNIEDKQLDDCWVLNSDKVAFNTPKYQLTFTSSAKENFLQAYTPPKENTIAIEPTTGVSDSFNNKIGLQTLHPNEAYAITWAIHIQNN